MPYAVRDTVRMHFVPAAQGTKEEIIPGVFVNIDGHYVSEDKHHTLTCISTGSDYKWQLDCLLDRLFHPSKYEKHGENVEETVSHLVEWLNEHEPPRYKGFKCDFKGLVNHIRKLPENELVEAESQLKSAFKEIR